MPLAFVKGVWFTVGRDELRREIAMRDIKDVEEIRRLKEEIEQLREIASYATHDTYCPFDRGDAPCECGLQEALKVWVLGNCDE